MKKRLTFLFMVGMALGVHTTFAQIPPIKVHGDFGIATATGDFAGPDLNIGIGYAINATYIFNSKLDAGIEYDASAIVTADVDGADADATGMSGFLAKAHYRFLDKKVTPYAGLGLGLYNVELPTVTFTDNNGDTQTIEGENKVNFGFSPEAGLALGGFIIGAKFSFAGKTPGDDPVNATYMRYFLGWTFTFGD